MEAIRTQSLALAFQKLNLAAIPERGKWLYRPFSMCPGIERR